MVNVQHFHCVSERDDASKLSHELTVPIWRLSHRGIEWKLFRSCSLPNESYDEDVRCIVGNLYGYRATDCNNNARGLKYRSLFSLLGNEWPIAYNSVCNSITGGVVAPLGLIKAMCKLFYKMEEDLHDLSHSFRNIVDAVGEKNTLKMNDSSDDDAVDDLTQLN
ncbi:uncharacterized protein LOC128305229 [Anopheles moucheti]|uniref:uncharacterized protein LOC128305229 n=1 Tax=Anopheles moucheti TaxID=186751 RepID=UPI0022F01503|nr:uncharacterized protein LOC128305229 [Anopheles moucheti]